MPSRLLLLIVLLALSRAAAAAGPEVFAGSWVGREILRSDGFETVAENLFFRLEPAADGFRLEWKTPGRTAEQARFKATRRQGVYAVQHRKRGLMGLFSSSESIDPLAGEPLLWARLADDSLIVYRMTIDERGGFVLDRYQATIQGDSLRVHFTRHAHGQPERILDARLERGGGAK